MTKQKKIKPNLIEIGKIIEKHRKYLDNSSREQFIYNSVDSNLVNENWISLKTLSNIENGYTLPTLKTLKLLSIALQINFNDLISEIDNFILDDE